MRETPSDVVSQGINAPLLKGEGNWEKIGLHAARKPARCLAAMLCWRTSPSGPRHVLATVATDVVSVAGLQHNQGRSLRIL